LKKKIIKKREKKKKETLTWKWVRNGTIPPPPPPLLPLGNQQELTSGYLMWRIRNTLTMCVSVRNKTGF
jgi:hypothetical protein